MGLTSLTVFVVPDDTHGAHLRETFIRWSGEHLVGQSAWVTPSSTEIPGFGPPKVQADIVDDGTSYVEDLFRFIGKRRLDVVRVVLGQLVLSDDLPVDGPLLAAANSIVDAIDRALPKSARGHSTHLSRINVVAPVSGVSSVHPGCIMQGWSVNAIVAAEDRPDADHANVFVRDPGNAVGHMAAALAAAGGVFSGVQPGMFDALAEGQSTSNGREMLVIRVAVRAVAGDDAETVLAVKTLETVEAEPNGAAAFVEWGRAAVNPERVVIDLQRHLTGRDPWRSVEPMRAPHVGRRREGFKEALGNAFRFDLKMFAVVPGWFARRGKAKLEDLATDAIVGRGGDALVRFNPSSPEGMKSSAAEILRHVDEAALKSEFERAAASVATPDASAWAHLRSLAFAAVDGGGLPAGVDVPRHAGLREVLPATRVVPDPLDSFEARGRTVMPFDVAGTRALGDEILEDLQRFAAELSMQQDALDDAEREVLAAGEVLAAANAEGESPGEAIATDSVAQARHALQAAEDAREGARLSAERARSVLEVVERENVAFRDWAARIEGSLASRLVEDVDGRASELRKKHDGLRSGVTREAPANDDLVRRQRTLVRSWVVAVAIWFLLLLTVGIVRVVLVQRQRKDPQALDTLPEGWVWLYEQWLWVALGVTALAFVVLWFANHTYYRANRRYLRAVQRAEEVRLRASEDLVYTGHESARLGHLSTMLIDWSSIIGWVLHHPFTAVEDLTRDLDSSVVETLPAAFAIARTSPDDEIPKQTIVQAVRLLHPEGWAASAFDHAHGVHQAQTVSQDPAGMIAADLDGSDSTYGPRRELLQFWEGGGASEVLTAESVDKLRQAVQDGEIVLATRRVSRLGEYSTGDVVSEPEFYRGVATADTAFVGDMFTESARVEGKHNVHRSVVWLPAVAERDATDDEIKREVATQSVAIRVDISRSLTTEDLAVFQGGARATGTGSAVGQRASYSAAVEAGESTEGWA